MLAKEFVIELSKSELELMGNMLEINLKIKVRKEGKEKKWVRDGDYYINTITGSKVLAKR